MAVPEQKSSEKLSTSMSRVSKEEELLDKGSPEASTSNQTAGKSLIKFCPKHSHEISVRTSEDKFKCLITGMTLLNSNQLVIADDIHHLIKMIDIDQKSITDQLKLHGQPWDVTTVTNDQLAVTLPHSQSILFVSVSLNKLEMAHTLKVDGNCRGITYYQGKLVVSLDSPAILNVSDIKDPAKLQVIDLKGNILMSVTNDSAGEPIFSHPQYVTVNMESIYVSDYGKSTIFRFNWQGELIGKDESIDFPLGLVMLEDCSFLASDANKNSLQHVCSDFAERHVILKDLTFPRAISWCNENSMLFISSSTITDETDNFIQVFKML